MYLRICRGFSVCKYQLVCVGVCVCVFVCVCVCVMMMIMMSLCVSARWYGGHGEGKCGVSMYICMYGECEFIQILAGQIRLNCDSINTVSTAMVCRNIRVHGSSSMS